MSSDSTNHSFHNEDSSKIEASGHRRDGAANLRRLLLEFWEQNADFLRNENQNVLEILEMEKKVCLMSRCKAQMSRMDSLRQQFDRDIRRKMQNEDLSEVKSAIACAIYELRKCRFFERMLSHIEENFATARLDTSDEPKFSEKLLEQTKTHLNEVHDMKEFLTGTSLKVSNRRDLVEKIKDELRKEDVRTLESLCRERQNAGYLRTNSMGVIADSDKQELNPKIVSVTLGKP